IGDDRLRALGFDLECGNQRVLGAHHDMVSLSVQLQSDRIMHRPASSSLAPVPRARRRALPAGNISALERRRLRPHMDSAPIGLSEAMSDPLSRLAMRVAYGASQLPRVAWYVGHNLAMRRLSEEARQREGSTRPRARTDRPVPDRGRLYADMGAL